MNDDQKRKLEMARAAQTSKAMNQAKGDGVSIFVNAELDELYKKLDSLLTTTAEKIDEAGDRMADTTKINLVELNDHLVKVTNLISKSVMLMGEDKTKEVIVKNFPEQVNPINYDDTKQIKELVENRKAIADLNKGLANIADQIADGLEGLKPSQLPDEFIPFRRVYKAGNRLMFDDESWVSARGGGGGASSSSSGSVIIQDAGGEQATVTGGKLDVNASASLAGETIPVTGASEAVAVAIVDTSGDQIASFGGGTQYTEGDTDATITGTAMLWEDGSDTLRTVSAAKPLPIGDAGGSITVDGTFWQATQPVSGTVTANIGTAGTLATAAKQDTIIGHVDGIEGVLGTIDADTGNISTKIDTVATDTTAIAASASVLDDWDESDRAKVNLIAGQAGVQGASGTVTALTQRVVLATDVALPAGTNAIGKLAANSGVDIGDVDVTSSALPTGASTSAKQPALGTAGSASTDVITIQGIASMTKLLVTPDANSAVNVAQINGVTPLMGAGNTGTGSPRVTIATDQAAVKVTQTPAATGGLSTMMATSADGSTALTSTAQAIKASAGQLFGWYIFNPNSVIAYVNIYNTASGSVTVGTTNPLTMLAIPPSSAANAFSDNGIAFGTAMSVAAVMTTAGGTTAPTVALEANFFYA